MVSFRAFFLFSALAVTAVQGQRVLQMQCLTADKEDAGMTLASVNIELQSGSESCFIEDLTNPGNTFARGNIDVFEGNSTMLLCNGFSAPDNDITLIVSHNGFDAWVPEWFRVLLDDSSFVQCNDGYSIDNFEVHIINCDFYPGK
jgi:hypothetical protein